MVAKPKKRKEREREQKILKRERKKRPFLKKKKIPMLGAHFQSF